MGVINKLANILSTGRLKISSDTSVTTQSVSIIEAQTTNTSIILKPNGTGGIIAMIPDGTAAGGNARGPYSIELMPYRVGVPASAVASGWYSVIIGGQKNTAAGDFSIALGNTNTTSAPYATITGGANNTINAVSQYSTISGGQSNTASTNTNATVVGGQSNTASGLRSTAGNFSSNATGGYSIAMGDSVTASGLGAIALGGQSLSASGTRSGAFGFAVQATGAYSYAFGTYLLTYLQGQFTTSGTNFSDYGTAQQSILVANKSASLTTAATTVLSLDGTGTTNLIIPNGNNRAWKVKVEWISTVTTITGTATGITVGDMAYGEANFGFKKVSGTSVLGNFINDEGASDSAIMDTCSLGYSVGASQELALTFTGPTFAGGGSVTMRIVAKVSLVEVAY